MGTDNSQEISGQNPTNTRIPEKLRSRRSILKDSRRKLSQANKATSEITKKLKESEERATTDSLTGLKTKSLFDSTLSQEIATVERDRRSFPLELTVMDIDNFGAFNKQYGIPTGDEVLKMVGSTINNTLRTSDFAFRIGGEELAVISRKTHNPDKSGDKLVSERHNEAIRNSQSENGHKVTASVGQTDYIKGENKQAFIDRANTALIVAKRLGKDRAVLGEIVEGKEVYTDAITKKKYNVIKDTDGKLLEIKEIK